MKVRVDDPDLIKPNGEHEYYRVIVTNLGVKCYVVDDGFWDLFIFNGVAIYVSYVDGGIHFFPKSYRKALNRKEG